MDDCRKCGAASARNMGLRVREVSYGGVLPGCALLRRTVFDTVGFFDESLNSGETVAWMMKLRESALPAASLELVTLERRLHLSNTGRVDPKQEMRSYAAILRKRMGGQLWGRIAGIRAAKNADGSGRCQRLFGI